MAPTVRKRGETAGNGELRQRKKKEEDADDDELLDAGGTGFLDQFIMLNAFIFIFTSAASLFKSSKEGAVDDAASSGKGAGEAKKKSGEKEKTGVMEMDKEAVKEAAREQLKKNAIPVFLLVVGFLTCLLIICGEGFGEKEDRPKQTDEDYYGTLGVTRDAETPDVKRAYKTLARRWHPDKNPNCTTCQDTFSKIATAYETLSDTEKRAAYDESGGIATAELKSPRSVPLTLDNFDQLVTYSNDVWIVQIFKPDDGNCAQFHPFWENQIQKNGHLVRFGRVDITNDLGKWLPVKYRVLPTVLKFGRHLSSPEIFPITAMHETPQMLMKFVLTSFPNIGLPLHLDSSGVRRWVQSAGRRHKVLLAIPGKSEEERYKSHLVPRKMASRWSELFEFRTAETSRLLQLSDQELPSEIRSGLPSEKDAKTKAAIFFFSANGDTKPKASALIPWETTEDEMVTHLLGFAEMAAPALTPRTADLLCRSPSIRRVYCLVLLDPPDSAVKRAMEELADSRTQYSKEVADIREQGGEVGDDEDNFIVPAMRLFRRTRGLQPSVSTCRAPKFGQIEQALDGAHAMLLDLDTNRIAVLKGLTSFRGVYPQIAYEESLTWIDEALHPFLSLPDCDEGLLQHFARTIRSGSMLGLLVQFVTIILLLEAVAHVAVELGGGKRRRLVAAKWGVGAGVLLLIFLCRMPPFTRRVSGYLPSMFFAPTLLTS